MARHDDIDVRLLRALRSGANSGKSLALGELMVCSGLQATPTLEHHLQGLRAAGYRIAGEVATGWRLLEAPATLIADDVLATLPATPPRTIGREILVFEETDSTNDLAARAGDGGAAEGLVFFAEKQRAGRGRQGRVWESPPGQSLLLSLLLRPFNVPTDRWPELTFCAALAVAETAERQTGQAARIKWPNDVLMNGRKIAGILLERHQRQLPGFVVVGIGVNVLQIPENFDPMLRQRAGSLAMMTLNKEANPVERRLVAASLLQNLEKHYSAWPTSYGAIMQACLQRGCQALTEQN